MKVLDLGCGCGCGFGGFALYAAEKYGCDVVGVTVSKEPQRFGMDVAKKRLSVDLRLADYRNVGGTYRMWKFYLLSAAGAVAARESQLFHLVLTHAGDAHPDSRFS